MNVLVTGAAGLLGAHFVAGFSATHNVVGVDRHPWWGDLPARILEGDLNEPAFLASAIADAAPQVLIHCAAMVDVDRCETDPNEAFRANFELTRQVATQMRRDCLFVYISTDSVFNGASAYWSENNVPSPLNAYGRSKLAGESEAAKCTNHLIIRTNFYGWSSGRKKTAAEWLYRSLNNNEHITLFDDFFFTPIYVVDFVRYVNTMVKQGARGLFHVAGRDRVSKFQFGETMGRAMGLPMTNVSRGSLAAARLNAPRAADISLSTERARKTTGMDLPGCEDGVRRFLSDRDIPLGRRF